MGSKVETHCIFCGKTSEQTAWIENGFVGKRCDCGLLYISPRPEPQEILNLYNSHEADLSAKSRIEGESAARLSGRHRLKLIKKYLIQGSLLEIGPGGGYFLDESRSAGFDPFGLELNFRQAKFIKDKLKIPVETNYFSESSFAGTNFDIICHFDVISHFYDPISEFKKFGKRLKDGGILFFETGNGGDLSQAWLKFIGRLQYPQHLFLFSKKNIEQLCTRTGFEIIGLYDYSIFLQILVMKLLQWATKSIERTVSKKSMNVLLKDFQKIPREHSCWKALASKSVIFLSFWLRYRVGRVLPKFGPQTIIYVAKKVDTVT